MVVILNFLAHALRVEPKEGGSGRWISGVDMANCSGKPNSTTTVRIGNA